MFPARTESNYNYKWNNFLRLLLKYVPLLFRLSFPHEIKSKHLNFKYIHPLMLFSCLLLEHVLMKNVKIKKRNIIANIQHLLLKISSANLLLHLLWVFFFFLRNRIVIKTWLKSLFYLPWKLFLSLRELHEIDCTFTINACVSF